MNWLVFVFALECGLLPNTGFAMYQPDLNYVTDVVGFYADLSCSVEFFGFYIGGGMRSHFWKYRKGVGLWPYQTTFRLGAGWRNEFLDIGIRHYSIRPVVPYLALTGAPLQNWEGAYEEIFIRVEGRLPLIKKKERQREM